MLKLEYRQQRATLQSILPNALVVVVNTKRRWNTSKDYPWEEAMPVVQIHQQKERVAEFECDIPRPGFRKAGFEAEIRTKGESCPGNLPGSRSVVDSSGELDGPGLASIAGSLEE